MVERLFLAVPRGCLRFVIVVFLDHTHLLFLLLLLIHCCSHCLWLFVVVCVWSWFCCAVFSVFFVSSKRTSKTKYV